MKATDFLDSQDTIEATPPVTTSGKMNAAAFLDTAEEPYDIKVPAGVSPDVLTKDITSGKVKPVIPKVKPLDKTKPYGGVTSLSTAEPEEKGMFSWLKSKVRATGKTDDTKAYAATALAEETGLPISFVYDHFDEVTGQAGIRTKASNKEIVDNLMGIAVGAGLLTNPVGTAIGVGTFMGLSEIENAGVQKLKGEKYKYGQGRELREFFGELNPTMDVVADVGEFVAKGALTGGIIKGGKKVVVPPNVGDFLKRDPNVSRDASISEDVSERVSPEYQKNVKKRTQETLNPQRPLALPAGESTPPELRGELVGNNPRGFDVVPRPPVINATWDEPGLNLGNQVDMLNKQPKLPMPTNRGEGFRISDTTDYIPPEKPIEVVKPAKDILDIMPIKEEVKNVLQEKEKETGSVDYEAVHKTIAEQKARENAEILSNAEALVADAKKYQEEKPIVGSEPVTAYHVTQAKPFDKFQDGMAIKSSEGMYFFPTLEQAEKFASPNSRIVKVQIDMGRTTNISEEGQIGNFQRGKMSGDYDTATGEGMFGKEIVVFNPDKIKIISESKSKKVEVPFNEADWQKHDRRRTQIAIDGMLEDRRKATEGDNKVDVNELKDVISKAKNTLDRYQETILDNKNRKELRLINDKIELGLAVEKDFLRKEELLSAISSHMDKIKNRENVVSIPTEKKNFNGLEAAISFLNKSGEDIESLRSMSTKDIMAKAEAVKKMQDESIKAMREKVNTKTKLAVENKKPEQKQIEVPTIDVDENVLTGHISNLQSLLDDSKKQKSIDKIENFIDKNNIEDLEETIPGVQEIRGLLDEYRDIERTGMSPEEYKDAKQEVWDAIQEHIEGLKIDLDAVKDIKDQQTKVEVPVVQDVKQPKVSRKTVNKAIAEAEAKVVKTTKEKAQEIEDRRNELKKESDAIEQKITEGTDTLEDIDRLLAIEKEKLNLDKKPKKEKPGFTLSLLGAQDIYERTVKLMKSTTYLLDKALRGSTDNAQTMRGLRAAKVAMLKHDRSINNAEAAARLFEKVVNDAVPNIDKQLTMVFAFENKNQGKHWDSLTKKEQDIIEWLGKEKDKIEAMIKENDTFEMMAPEEGIRHVFHHWINPKTGTPYSAMYGKFSKGLPQAKQRTIKTYEQGMATVYDKDGNKIKDGLIPATTNLGKLIGLELESVVRANNARTLFASLHGVLGDSEASITMRGQSRPIRMVENWLALQKQGLTNDYVKYDSAFLNKAIVFPGSDGRKVVIKGSVGIQKDLFPFVQAYIEDPSYGRFSELNFATKSLRLGFSLFHVMSLGMQELANMRVPFVHIPEGLKLLKELGPTVRLLHQEGLNLFKKYEDLGQQRNMFELNIDFNTATKKWEYLNEEGGFSGRTAHPLPYQIANTVFHPIEGMKDFIFGYVQPGMKISFANMLFNKLAPEYMKDTGWTVEEALSAWNEGKILPTEVETQFLKCAREVVQKSDGHFSGENVKRGMLETNQFMIKMYFSPAARKFWQGVLLAPTWQREHMLIAKNVMKSFMPDSAIDMYNKGAKKTGLTNFQMEKLGPIKSQYRKYMYGGLLVLAAVDAINYNNSLVMDGEGKHMWENPEGKGFAVRGQFNYPDYEMEDRSGNTISVAGGAGYYRPIKSLFEIAEWFSDPVVKLGYKLSPMVSAVGNQLFNPMRRYDGVPDVPRRAIDFALDTTMSITIEQAVNLYYGKIPEEAVYLPAIGFSVSKLAEEKHQMQDDKEIEDYFKPTDF